MKFLIARLDALIANGDADDGTVLVRVTTLREVTAELRRVREAPVVEVARVHVGDHGPHVIYTALPQGQRVRLVPEREQVSHG